MGAWKAALWVACLMGAWAPSAQAEAPDAATPALTIMGLQSQLQSAISGNSEARTAIVARAQSPDTFGTELNVFLAQAKELRVARKVQVTGITLRGTAWWGILPMRDFEVFWWITADVPRVLRLDSRPSTRHVFDGLGRPVETAPMAVEMLTLTHDLTQQAVAGKCREFPAVRSSDFAPVLPESADGRRKTLSHLERLKFRLPGQCKAWKGVVHHQISGEITELSLMAFGTDGVKANFRIQLALRENGNLAIVYISALTVAPRAN